MRKNRRVLIFHLVLCYRSVFAKDFLFDGKSIREGKDKGQAENQRVMIPSLGSRSERGLYRLP
jgi:hypothetical protein